MIIKKLKDCEEFIAGDKTVLRELLHPSKADVKCRYSLAHATVKSGASSTPHILKTTEVYYILAGEGIMHIGDESERVRTGDMIYIPPNAKQYITNSGKTDLNFSAPLTRLGDPKMKSYFNSVQLYPSKVA